jgi:hypothetical protein
MFLSQERCAVLLQNALRVVPASPTLPPHALPILDYFVTGEIRRILSARAQIRTLASIARETGWRILLLKGTVDVAENVDVPCSDVDVWCDQGTLPALVARLDSSGFTAGAHEPDLHAPARTMPGMLAVEVHFGVLGFPRPGDMPVDRAAPVAGLEPLIRLAPEDHAWTVLSQAVLKHPDRQTRIRDIVIIRRALNACTAQGRDRLDQRVKASAHRRTYAAMIRISEGEETGDGETFRHYLLMRRTTAVWHGFGKGRWRRAAGTGMSGIAAEMRRLRGMHAENPVPPGIARLTGSYALFAGFSAIATLLSLDVAAVQTARSVAAAAIAPLYLATGRWRTLLEMPAIVQARNRATVSPRTTERVVNGLSRLPLSPWQATCLYRCVAVCLLMRWSHVAAILRIGVGGADRTTAHAWIENPGRDVLYERRGAFAELR